MALHSSFFAFKKVVFERDARVIGNFAPQAGKQTAFFEAKCRRKQYRKNAAKALLRAAMKDCFPWQRKSIRSVPALYTESAGCRRGSACTAGLFKMCPL